MDALPGFSRRRIRFLGLVLCLAVPLGTASAEDEPPDEEQPSIEEHVVVTPTRKETPADRVGSSVTVIEKEDWTRKQYHLVQDVLREVPGLDLRRTGGPGSNVSLFTRGTDSDHTLLLVDGVEINDPSTPAGTPFFDHLTLDDVERIEVLRGPQSTLYGSDAIGGVVNVITGPGDDPGSSIWVEGGSYSTLHGGVTHSGGTDSLRYSFSASHVSSDRFSETSAGTEDDPYRSTSVAGGFHAIVSENLDFDLNVRHVDAATDFDGFGQELNHRIDATQSVLGFVPRLTLLDGRWEQSFGVRFARHDRDTTGDFPSKFNGALYGLDWQNDVRLRQDQTLTVGIEGEWQETTSTAFDDNAANLGVYAQHRFEGARWFGTVGARLDDHSRFGDHATYRVTGGRSFSTGTILRGSAGTGFNAPTLTELNLSAFAGNPDLSPEESWGFDLGVEQRFSGDRSVIGLTYFQNRVDDLIVAVFVDPVAATWLNLNVDTAAIRGAETSLRLGFESGFDAAATYTYTDTEARGVPAAFGLVEGGELLRRPRHKGSLDLHYRKPGTRADATLTMLHVGTRQDVDPVTFSATAADPYTVVHVAAGYDIGAGVQIFARVENVLDEEYEDVLGFQTAGRSGYGGVRVSF